MNELSWQKSESAQGTNWQLKEGCLRTNWHIVWNGFSFVIYSKISYNLF